MEEYIKRNGVDCKPNEILELLKYADSKEDQLHLAVLYSSPLGYEEADSKGGIAFKSLQELSFEKEIDQIK